MAAKPAACTTEAATVEKFAARVAHDFNNLLTGVLGHLELVELRAAQNPQDGVDSLIAGARQASGRAAELARRLVLFSGHTLHEREPIPLAPLLQELAIRPDCKGLDLKLPDETLCVAADTCGLRQAVLELLANAFETGTTVHLTAGVESGRVVVTVRDEGAGMTPEILARAGEPLFTTRSNGAGRGLGLAIARRVAEHAGGTLDLASDPQKGCTARLIFPIM
ncbi:Histidine kinase-, DNA gyrase B-, and HSP90-like ATPase [Acidocella aminolytica 101 = DSM 11237]|jgi:signal transduction histidine kinase|nr:signal transduction histidine kinase [Acidocella aminolytica 101 = DSM 11237]SHF21082.1 Histidine kinase-, DNA gyrase B-, and HSP90-like ATPase [Acidocella aminolytica 101 = DSM 11237]